MKDKTYKTAIVVIPPEEYWESIQAIRHKYDRQVRRWMPHITMIYPFRPADQLEVVAEELQAACRSVQPFQICLNEFRYFQHGRNRFTLWLAPNPKGELEKRITRLQDSWQPLRFMVDRISMIRRNEPPDDVFQVDTIIPFYKQ